MGGANATLYRCCRNGRSSTTFGAAWSPQRSHCCCSWGAPCWRAVVAGVLLVPPVIASLSDLAEKPLQTQFRQHLTAVLRAARRHVVQALLALAFLSYEAFFSL